MNLRTNSQLQQLVDSVMKNFDFNKVYQVMQCLNWSWATSKGSTEVPNVYTIIKFAEGELWHIVNEYYNTKETWTTSCGGFETNICWNDDKTECYLSLKFVVTDWSESLNIKDNEI